MKNWFKRRCCGIALTEFASKNSLSRQVELASVGGPFQSGHGPVERAGVLNFVGRERANLAGGHSHLRSNPNTSYRIPRLGTQGQRFAKIGKAGNTHAADA
jgi:hypothetical protein